jgi:hypothetical protein
MRLFYLNLLNLGYSPTPEKRAVLVIQPVQFIHITVNIGNREMATKFTIKLNTKPAWKISRGHSDYRGGAGKHDNRPRKLRTKSAQKNQAIKDFY